MTTSPAPASDFALHLKAAATLHQAGELTEAKKLYLEALALDPNAGHALRLLGALLLQTGHYSEAVSYLEKALTAFPQNIEIINNLGIALRNDGNPKEAIARYKEALKLNPDHVEALSNIGNAFSDIEEQDEAISHFKRALHLNADHLSSLIGLGVALLTRDQIKDAGVCLKRALSLQPNSLIALNNLGYVLLQEKYFDDALTKYTKALEIDPDNNMALIGASVVLRKQNKIDEATILSRKSVALYPNDVTALNQLAALYSNLGMPKEALELYEKALRINPSYSFAQAGMGFMLLTLGRYRDGWPLFQKRFHKNGVSFQNGLGPQIWDGSPLPGKSLLIWHEQGFGDSLQFIRYAALCKGRVGKVFVWCPEELLRLFKACPFIDDAFVEYPNAVFDAHIPMMGLALTFKTEVETIPREVPYLYVDETTALKWKKIFSIKTGLKVGLVWAGSSREGDSSSYDRRRSMSLELMKPLFDLKNIELYSLQMDASSKDIAAHNLSDRITDYTNEITDFMDTAGLIENLDLVITVDTSVAHLAGALGKPVWILSRYDADWRWLQNKETNPWYPTAHVFGQPTMGDWKSVIKQVYDALKNKAAL